VCCSKYNLCEPTFELLEFNQCLVQSTICAIRLLRTAVEVLFNKQLMSCWLSSC